MKFNWQFDYASKRMPVLADNVVATSQPLAAQAGLRMLQAGGNAVDAAIATAVALTVVEPTSNGIGGDAFALVYDGHQIHGLNASGKAPKAWSLEFFEGYDSMPETGWGSVTIPGAVSAWMELSSRFGQLPFVELFAPAIEYAKQGFIVSPLVAKQWQQAANEFTEFEDFNNAFLINAKAPEVGSRFKFPEQANSLHKIAISQGESFYQGELAQRIVDHAIKTGGAITLNDLAEHKAQWVQPIKHNYLNAELVEIPPNGQGLTALIALGILQHLQLSQYEVDSAACIHCQLEAMKLAFADAHFYIADPNFVATCVEELLSEDYLSERAKLVDMQKAQLPKYGVPKEAGTVYVTAADNSGMMVSFIQSNYMGFGSGIVIPETGISLQNRGSGFSLDPTHPNVVASAKRPYHTIIPAMLCENERPVMSFGVMGAHMQAQGHVQMLVRLTNYQQNPQAAIDAPRWYVHHDNTVSLEPGISTNVVDELAAKGHEIVQRETMFFGGAQAILKLDNGGYFAASDPRKDGLAVGY